MENIRKEEEGVLRIELKELIEMKYKKTNKEKMLASQKEGKI